MRLLLSLLILVSAGSAFAKARTPDGVVYAAHAFHQVLLGCPERVWPALDWRKTQFVFIQKSKRAAWLIGAEQAAPEELKGTERDSLLAVDYFTVVDFRGRMTVVTDLAITGRAKTEAFAFAVHEAFHEFKHQHLERAGAGGRAYPLESRPREWRKRLEVALIKGDLDGAAYWFRQWRDGYPAEVSASVDGREGSARYAERMSVALGELGCQAPGEKLAQFNMKWAKKNPVALREGLEGEGYWLGAVAGFQLDLTDPHWKTEAGDARSPLDILLGSRETAPNAPSGKPADPRVRAEVARLNAEIAGWIDPLERALADREFIRVALPNQAGATRVFIETFLPSRFQTLSYPVYAGGQDFGQNENDRLRLDGDVMTVRGLLSPCGLAQSEFVPVHESSLVAHRGEYSARTLDFSFTKRGRLEMDAAGFKYLCSN
ncbi:MAG TPA: hypothetical protein PKC28_10320 [Bdellovibrionales bacterium]|nr:hypothetical protein [Bdellovibrionales bacterium]